jgi:DNA-binding CsgD family transcriptional regulator
MIDFHSFLTCKTEADLITTATEQASAMGFEHWIYSVRILRNSAYRSDWSLSNLPPALARAYLGSESATDDPMAQRSSVEMTPRVWVLDPAIAEIGSPYGDANPLQREAARFGILGGMCTPLHDLAGAVGTLTLATCEPVTEASLMALSPMATLLSKYLHEACSRSMLDGAQRKERPALSPRELQCLDWAAKGKTSWEISRVLAISEHTAIFHLRNATSKLGSSSRQQAIAKSVQLGLLSMV